MGITFEARGVYGLTDVFVRTPRKSRAAFLTLGFTYDLVPGREVNRALPPNQWDDRQEVC